MVEKVDIVEPCQSESSWRPLFPPSEKESIDASILEIAIALRHNLASVQDISLGSGLAGIAIFFAYLSKYKQEPEYLLATRELVERIAEQFSDAARTPWLYAGFTGVAWALHHIRAVLPECVDLEDGAITEAIDSFLLEFLDSPKIKADFDLIRGIVGLGVYGLLTFNSERSKAIVSLVLRHLESISEVDERGRRYWRTLPQYFHWRHEAEMYPAGNRNLGLAHGNPGVIGFLAAATQKENYANDDVRNILHEAVTWMLSNRQPPPTASAFPAVAEKRGECRCAWCYGDLGAAISILRAGYSLHNQEFVSAGWDIAERTLERPFESMGVEDPMFCHGAVGLAHMYNRLFQWCGEDRYARRAREWVHRTLDFRCANEGIAGYRFFHTLKKAWVTDPGFLTGAAGIGLALLAAVQDLPPAWDEVLLIGNRP